MNAMDVRSGVFPADTSLINAEFIRRLQDQRALHKREAAFHRAEIDKHGAADEALESMIQAAEKIMAIMGAGAARAPDAFDEATPEAVSERPAWTEATTPAIENAEPPQTYVAQPATYGHEALMSADRAANAGNSWRAKLLGGAG